MKTDAKVSQVTKVLKRFAGWFMLLTGFAVHVAAQGTLLLPPLWSRDLPPEVDDSLAFPVRTQVMEECFFARLSSAGGSQSAIPATDG